jgi:hypothetical protein
MTAVGCSGFDSSVDGSKQLKDLSDEEATTLCEESEEFRKDATSEEDVRKLNCVRTGIVAWVFAGFADMDGEAACQEAYDDCLAKPAPSTEEVCANAPVWPCTATVNDQEECLAESVDMIKDFIANFSCSKPDESAGATTEACKKVEASCT